MKWLIITILFSTVAFSQLDIGSNYELERSGNRYTATIYSYEKYYHNSTGWHEINESFYDCGTAKCTREYHYSSVAYTNGTIRNKIKDKHIDMQITDMMFYSPFISEVRQNGSVVRYELLDGITLEYQYLSYRQIETFIINMTKIGKYIKKNKNYNISFKIGGDAGVIFTNPIMYDDYDQITLKSWVTSSKAIVEVPSDWMLNDSRDEIIYIDPDIIINGTNITLDYWIYNRSDAVVPDTFKKTLNPTAHIVTGFNRVCRPLCPTYVDIYRGYIEHDIDFLPKNIDAIISYNLTVYQNQVGNNTKLQIKSLLRNNSYFNDDNQTEWQSVETLNTIIANQTFNSVGYKNISLINASPLILNQIRADGTWFGTTFKWDKESLPGFPSITMYPTRFTSKDAVDQTKRPYYRIIFNLTDCIYTGTGNWNIRTFCNINKSKDTNICGNNIIINESGQVNISKDVELNFTSIIIDHNPDVGFKLALADNISYRKC